MKTLPASLASEQALAFCRSVCAQTQPISIPHRPLLHKPLMECLSIVPEHIATHGGEQLTGWAIWHADGLHIEGVSCGVESADG